MWLRYKLHRLGYPKLQPLISLQKRHKDKVTYKVHPCKDGKEMGKIQQVEQGTLRTVNSQWTRKIQENFSCRPFKQRSPSSLLNYENFLMTFHLCKFITADLGKQHKSLWETSTNSFLKIRRWILYIELKFWSALVSISHHKLLHFCCVFLNLFPLFKETLI
jgi:hypothetical protein